MILKKVNLQDLQLTDDQVDMIFYNNLVMVKNMLCYNLGSNWKTHSANVRTLEKYIFT